MTGDMSRDVGEGSCDDKDPISVQHRSAPVQESICGLTWRGWGQNLFSRPGEGVKDACLFGSVCVPSWSLNSSCTGSQPTT
jgi:hypothetical protein